MRYFPILLTLLASVGCGPWRATTLRATWVPEVPHPNARLETAMWDRTEPLFVPLERGAGPTHEERGVELRAVHDGRALSILALWPDPRESISRRAWVWNPAQRDYALEEQPVDQLMFLWPIEPEHPSFCMFDPTPAIYDVWQWRAAWTDRSGFADDRRLIIRPHPADTPPASHEGRIYPANDGRSRVEIVWREDSGGPGTRPTLKPRHQQRPRMPGATYDPTTTFGSAADVRATGLYNPATPKIPYAYWFVEFHRLLKTATPREDYSFEGAGPHRFAVGLTDNASGGDHFVSQPLTLLLDPGPSD